MTSADYKICNAASFRFILMSVCVWRRKAKRKKKKKPKNCYLRHARICHRKVQALENSLPGRGFTEWHAVRMHCFHRSISSCRCAAAQLTGNVCGNARALALRNVVQRYCCLMKMTLSIGVVALLNHRFEATRNQLESAFPANETPNEPFVLTLWSSKPRVRQ